MYQDIVVIILKEMYLTFHATLQNWQTQKSFLQQINLKVKDKSISKFIDEKKRNCYHIEIIQKK